MNTSRVFKFGVSFAAIGALALLALGACSQHNGVVDPNGNGNGKVSCASNPTAEGCSCDSPGQQVECGEVIRRSGDFVTCSMGHRTCTGGQWGVCEGDKIALHSVAPITMDGVSPQNVPCADDPCNPNCSQAEDDGGIDAAIQSAEGGGLTLVPSNGGCTGLQCQVVSCDGGTPTTITGTVTDPAGYRPINSAFVYVPNAALQPFPAGVQNDPCGGGGTLSGSPIVSAQTGVDGTFTLQNVPVGANIPLVIQVGRWRRKVTIPNVPACAVTNANNAIGFTGTCANPVQSTCSHSLCTTGIKLTNGCDNGAQACVAKVCAVDSYCCNNSWDQSCVNEISAYCGPMQCPACPAAPPANYGALHLPQDKTQGDIPLMSLVTGGCDMFECLLKRIGVSPSEFTPNNGTGRVHMYKGIGGYPLKGGSPSMGTYFANQAQVNQYDISLLPCDCGSEYGATNYNGVAYGTAQNELVQFTNVGGRFFTSHWGRNWIERPSGGVVPYPGVANWIPDSTCGQYGCKDPITGYVDTTFPKGNTFAQWLALARVGASNPFNITPTRIDVKSVNAPTERWVYARSDNGGTANPDVIVNFAFNTPLNAMTKNSRVAFSDTHVSSQDGFNHSRFGTVFPTICNPSMNMTAQEKALEYMFFDLSACNVPVMLPPYTAPVTFQVDYSATCPNTQKLVWRFFDWKAIAPSDSNIVFKAQTADLQSQLAAATTVGLGTASVALATAAAAPPPPANWIGTDVSVRLATIPSLSHQWLRVTIIMNPSTDGYSAPTLSSWRQLYDCVDNL